MNEENFQIGMPRTSPSIYNSEHWIFNLDDSSNDKDIYKAISDFYEIYEDDWFYEKDLSKIDSPFMNAIENLMRSSFFNELLVRTKPYIHAIVMNWIVNKHSVYKTYPTGRIRRLKNIKRTALIIYWILKTNEYIKIPGLEIESKKWYSYYGGNSFYTRLKEWKDKNGIPEYKKESVWESLFEELKRYPKALELLKEVKRQKERKIEEKQKNHTKL